MKYKTTVYTFTFQSILWGGYLHFPGRYGMRRGPFKNVEEAKEEYVRVLRECYFIFEPDKEVRYKERTLVPEPFVPLIDYQI